MHLVSDRAYDMAEMVICKKKSALYTDRVCTQTAFLSCEKLSSKSSSKVCIQKRPARYMLIGDE
jgi:hypothetical protein